MTDTEIERLESENLAATLSTFTTAELAPLYTTLTKPTFEWLSLEDRVKAAHPAHDTYSDLIAHHLRRFGGNTFANIGRGAEGPPYREIVRDVCRSRKVKVGPDAGVVAMETALLAQVFASFPEDEKRLLLEEAAERYGYSADLSGPAGAAAAMAAQAGGRAAGFLLYSTGLRVANIVSRLVLRRGASFLGNQAIVRTLGLAAGPVGWGISGLLAAKDIASPALRVTTPCVILIAGTRQAKLWQAAMGTPA